MNTVTKEEIKEKQKKGLIIPLSSDLVFKSVFIRNEKVLVKMVNDIFGTDEKGKPFTVIGVETIAYKNDGKTYRGDILIQFSDYSFVLVEMNNQKEANVIDRNMVNLVRIHSQALEKGEEDESLKNYRLRGLNFNNFSSLTGKEVEHYAICEIESGKIASLIYTFCNIDIAKCHKLVYNLDINIKNLSNSVRWGAIMKEESLDKISEILGEDMLSMEEKERFINTIRELNNDEKFLDDWVIEANARMKLKNQIQYAEDHGYQEGMEKGIEKGMEKGAEVKAIEVIKNMLLKNTDYNFIAEITGKTINEIKKIENAM